jgi:hypothetical protein
VWRTARKTLKRVFIILLLLVLVLGGVGAYYWSKSAELIRQGMIARLRDWAPNAKFTVGECTFDWLGRVHLDGFSITLPDEQAPLIDLPQTIVEVNRDALIQRQRVDVEMVRFIRPTVDLIRNPDGSWNWQKLPPIPQSDDRPSLPECRLEQAQLRLKITQPDGFSSGTIVLENANLSLTPNGKRSFLIKGRTRIDRVGFLTIDGNLNVDTRTGTLSGKLSGVRVGRDLMSYVSNFEPRVSQTVVKLEEQLRAQMAREPDLKSKSPFSIEGLALRQRTRPLYQPAVSTNTPVEIRNVSTAVPSSSLDHRIPVDWIGDENSILGLLADLDVDFRIQHLSPESKPDVRMLVTLTGGEITNTALPFPLTDLAGQVEYAANQVVLRDVSAKNGPTRLTINGTVAKVGGAKVGGAKVGGTKAGEMTTGRIDVSLENLACDERLRSRLSAGFGKIYDMHHPKGNLDMSVSLVSTDEGKWKPQDLVVTAKKCSVLHDMFPYPVRDAVGSIRQEGRDLKFNLLGYAGTRPITLRGYVQNPGPEAHVVLNVEVEKLPLDQQFLDACNPKLQKILTTMGLSGLVDAHWTLERQPGLGQKMKPHLIGSLHDATMVYQPFPYRVENLSGELEFDGLDWEFRNLKGTHGQAKLSAFGTYKKSHGPGDMQLQITTENAPIDQSLYLALTPPLKALWAKFSPGGTIEKSVTRVSLFEGHPAAISLPEIRIKDGTVLCREFPYQLEGIRAEYVYMPSSRESRSAWLTIKSFAGRHDQTRLTADGYVEIEPAGDWRFHLKKWNAEDLVPDNSLLRACGTGLRDVFASFDPNQTIDIQGELELRGTGNPKDPITAGWRNWAQLSGGKVLLGMDLDDVHGEIFSEGTWNGTEASVDGTVNFSTLTVYEEKRFRLSNVKGPFTMKKGILTAGASRVIARPTRFVADKEEQITGRFLNGDLAINVEARLDKVPEYRLSIDLQAGQLERFAQLYLRSSEKLKGTINGWVTLQGSGETTKAITGRGQMQISPAELYELPVIFQVLTQLRTLHPKSPDKAAFNYALARFRIGDDRFIFDAIDLVGTQLQLQGRGVATFDGRLGLTFASILQRSMVGRRSQVWIPIVTEAAGLFSGVTDLVGVAVEVTGTTDNPKTRIIPGRNIDQALRNFFESIRPLPLTPPPYSPLARPMITRPR